MPRYTLVRAPDDRLPHQSGLHGVRTSYLCHRGHPGGGDGIRRLGKVFDTVHYKTTIQSCDHCAQSLLSPQEYFMETFSTMESDLRDLVLKYWPNTKPIYCKNCKFVKYCSNDCRTQSWNTYHEIICPARSSATARLFKLSENLGKEPDETGTMVEVWDGHFSPLILARVWATIVTTAKSLARESGDIIPTKDQWAMAKSPYRK